MTDHNIRFWIEQALRDLYFQEDSVQKCAAVNLCFAAYEKAYFAAGVAAKDDTEKA